MKYIANSSSAPFLDNFWHSAEGFLHVLVSGCLFCFYQAKVTSFCGNGTSSQFYYCRSCCCLNFTSLPEELFLPMRMTDGRMWNYYPISIVVVVKIKESHLNSSVIPLIFYVILAFWLSINLRLITFQSKSYIGHKCT